MKTDREFLDEMWEKVSQLEYEETQRKAAKIQHRKITTSHVITTLCIIIAFAFFIFTKPKFSEMEVYIIAAISLTAAYWLDKFISGENENNKKSERTNLNEN